MKRPAWSSFAVVLLVLLSSGDKGTPAADDPHEHGKAFDTCAKACADCTNSCVSCYHHWRVPRHRGKQRPPEDHDPVQRLRGSLLDRRQTHLATQPCRGLICDACAKTCDECGAACAKFPQDQHMAACAKACQDCATACREMIQHVPG